MNEVTTTATAIYHHIDSQRGAYAAAKRAKSDATRAYWLAIVAREALAAVALIEKETGEEIL